MQKRFFVILFVLLISCSTMASTFYERQTALAPSSTPQRSVTGLITYEQQVIDLVNGTRIYGYDLELENIALNHLAFRAAGSPGANEAANWTKQEFESFGLEAWLEPFQFYNWTLLSKPSLIADEDGNYSTKTDQTSLCSFQSEHYSWPAPPGGVFADLVVLPLPPASNRSEIGANSINMTAWDLLNTTGKIVLVGKEIRWDATWEQTWVSKITTERPAAVVYPWWYSWMNYTPQIYSSAGGRPLSRRCGTYYWNLQIPVGCVNYEDGLWLRQQEQMGNISASFSLESIIGNGSHYNVVGKISGYQNPEKLVIISSHYDTVMCSGFCDNGAGTAAVIELANVFSDAINRGLFRSRYTLFFVAFAGEELDLVGSTNYVKQHKNDMPNTIAVINLDTLGNKYINISNTDPAAGIDLDELVIGAAQDLNIGITAEGTTGAADGDSFRVPSEVNDVYYQLWGLDPGISDAKPVNSSTMIFSNPSGWMHTTYDNSTSTGTLNWVEPTNLEDQVKVAALSIMRVSPPPAAAFPQREWKYTTGGAIDSSPAVADVDGDGQLEVIVGSSDNRVYCLNGATGALKWSYTTGKRVFSSPAIADINRDGKLEVLVGSDDNHIYCLNGTTGAKLWNYTTGKSIESSPAVADVVGDGHLEVLVGSLDKKTYCLNGATGAQEWNYTTGGWAWSSPTIVDANDDGHLEVVVGSEDNQVYCLNGTAGTKLWNYTTGALVDSSPAVADVDGDGHLEALVGSYDNKTYCLSGATGAQKWNYTTEGNIYSSPVVADVNDDGHLEVLIGSEDKNVYCLSVVGAPFKVDAYPWPSIGFRGDVRHSGCFIDPDTDGLTDGYEVTAGTDPHNPDTDADGITDYQEFLASSNPLLDEVPPAAITNLATSSPTDNSVTLTWVAPGDNGNNRNATGYWVKYSTSGPINASNWASATNYTQHWTPVMNGSTETHVISGLASGTTYWFAVRPYDKVLNYGGVSNSPRGTTSNTMLTIVVVAGIGGAVIVVILILAVLHSKKGERRFKA
nr:PQQ-binding-like beta-propeller repeat protein [Candidatus Njordarchaeota archaeon]